MSDTSKSKRVGVDEQFINFESSPNLKVMKKFIISKIGNTETTNRTSPSNPPDPPPPPNLDNSLKIKPEVQLAADALEASTSELPGAMKVESDEYQGVVSTESSENCTRQEDMASEYGAEKTKEPAKPSESTIMCRDFVRGTCKRPGKCRFAHKFDKSQLYGVYTFCKNFQNKVCTYPNCKYVHASFFEEQDFYRTGKLPPHVVVPKQPHTPSEIQMAIPATFTNPPPPLPASVGGSPMSACQGNRPQEAFQNAFNNSSGAPVAAAEGPLGQPPAKKCKFCGVMSVRRQFHQEVIDKKRASVAEMTKKCADMDKRKEKLNLIVMGLLRTMTNTPPASGTNSLMSMLNCENNQSIIDHLSSQSNSTLSSRLAAQNEDSGHLAAGKGLLNENYSFGSLMAKLLCDYQQAHSSDGTRNE